MSSPWERQTDRGSGEDKSGINDERFQHSRPAGGGAVSKGVWEEKMGKKQGGYDVRNLQKSGITNSFQCCKSSEKRLQKEKAWKEPSTCGCAEPLQTRWPSEWLWWRAGAEKGPRSESPSTWEEILIRGRQCPLVTGRREKMDEGKGSCVHLVTGRWRFPARCQSAWYAIGK